MQGLGFRLFSTVVRRLSGFHADLEGGELILPGSMNHSKLIYEALPSSIRELRRGQ